ncbi:unnamed protein product, partial [Effrenium voratum]
ASDVKVESADAPPAPAPVSVEQAVTVSNDDSKSDGLLQKVETAVSDAVGGLERAPEAVVQAGTNVMKEGAEEVGKILKAAEGAEQGGQAIVQGVKDMAAQAGEMLSQEVAEVKQVLPVS